MLIAFGLVTGMRKSEMLNLVWGDIDFDAGLVEVQPKANSAADDLVDRARQASDAAVGQVLARPRFRPETKKAMADITEGPPVQLLTWLGLS